MAFQPFKHFAGELIKTQGIRHHRIAYPGEMLDMAGNPGFRIDQLAPGRAGIPVKGNDGNLSDPVPSCRTPCGFQIDERQGAIED